MEKFEGNSGLEEKMKKRKGKLGERHYIWEGVLIYMCVCVYNV